MQAQVKDYWKLFKPSACHLRLQGATKEEVFVEVLECLVRARALDASLSSPALRALLERERLATTGVGQNVAIPHVKLRGLDEAVVSLAIHPEGLDWEAIDGDRVQIVFTVLRPEKGGDKHDPERHLEMMRWISQLGRAGDFRRFAVAVSNRTELVALLKEMSEKGV